MTETLFEFNGRNYLEIQNAFRGVKNQEYYLGDFKIDASGVIEGRAEKKAVGSCSIIRLTASTRMLFRRSWRHIRDDATDVLVFWFVKRGRLCVSHQNGYNVAEAGDFLITKSMSPFFVECQLNGESEFEAFHIVVPTHVFRRHVTEELKLGFSVRADRPEFLIAERMFWDVFEADERLGEEPAQILVEAAFAMLSCAIKGQELCGGERKTVADKRLQEVLRFIEIHLSDPKLSTTSVARACGISPRYLSFLLKLHGTPFSALVWDQRLRMAARWIASSRPRDISISEVAYRAGFKSPAHFSRMFKRVYKVSPREYRADQTVDVEPAAKDTRAEGASVVGL